MARPECDTPPLVNLWQGVHFGFWNMLEKYTCTCGNIPRDIGITFICTETCDVHVKSLTTNKQWSLLIWACLVIEPLWSKLVLTQKWVSLGWEATHVWYNDIYQSHEKATLLWFPNPVIHSFLQGSFQYLWWLQKIVTALSCQWDAVLEISVCKPNWWSSLGRFTQIWL